MQKLQSAQKYFSSNLRVYSRTTVQDLQQAKEFGSWDLTNAGLVHLGALPRLEFLNLSGNKQITDAGMDRINRLTDLRKLVLTGTKITDAGIRKLTALRNVVFMTLPKGVCGPGLRHVAANFNGLRDLAVNCPLGDAEWSALAGLDRVKDLDLSDAPIKSQTGLKQLNGMQSLAHLNLYNTGLEDAGLRELESKSLVSLTLGKNNLSAKGVENLPRLTGLRSLDLNHLKVKDFRPIGGIAGLEKLSLTDTGVSDADCKEIARLTRLKHLQLADTGISEKGIAHLKTLNQLEFLDISFTKVGGSAVWTLTDLPALKTVKVGGAGVGVIAIQWLRFRRPDLEILH